MNSPTPTDLEQRRKRLMRHAAIIGALAALLCQALPPDHRSVCTAVVKFASLTCGVSSP